MTQQLILDEHRGTDTAALIESPAQPIPFMNIETFARFAGKIGFADPKECWIWNGSLHKRGYGFFKLHGKNVKSHRLAFRLWNGSIPAGKVVLHRCDNPRCVNPAHLACGTQSENIADMDAKNRRAPKFGEINGSAKFFPLDVAEIRAAHFWGESVRSIASRYPHVARNSIRSVILRRSWTYGE